MNFYINKIFARRKSIMERMRKIVILALVLIMGVSLFAGCGQKQTVAPEDKATANQTKDTGSTTEQSGSSKDKKVVGVLIGDFSNQFHTFVMEGMKEKAKEYPNIEFVYVDGEFDPAIQMRQVENFIAQKVDAIIFMPGDAEASIPAQDLINENGIPLINVNTRLGKPDEVDTFAGSDCIQSGEILMQAMADLLGGKGKILELQGMYGHEPQIERHKGITNILAKYPDIEVLAEDSGEWSRDVGLQKMENWLHSDLRDKFDAVVCHNDEMAIGAMKAIEDAGLLDKVIIGGIDATPEMLGYLREGKVEVTVFQDAKGQGAASIEAAAKTVNGEPIEKEYMIPYVLVKPDEIDKYLELYQ
jgi:inositol transport system substrate-binding protein